MKAYRANRYIYQLIRNIIIKWRSLVNLMLWTLYSQNKSGYLREEKNFLPVQETKL